MDAYVNEDGYLVLDNISTGIKIVSAKHYQKLVTRIEALEEENESLQNQLESSVSEAIAVKTDCDVLKKEIKSLQRDNRSLTDQLDVANDRLMRARNERDELEKTRQIYLEDITRLNKMYQKVCLDLSEATVLRERNRASELEAKKIDDMTNINIGVAIGCFITRFRLNLRKEGYALASEYLHLFNGWYTHTLDTGELDELEAKYWSSLEDEIKVIRDKLRQAKSPN